MSVSAAKDQTQDLFAVADAARAAQGRNNDDERAERGDQPSAEALETRFSQMLKDRLSANMVFSRLDQQMDMPQRVISERAKSPIIDRRADEPVNDDIDTYDPTDSLEDKNRAEPIAASVTNQDYQRPTQTAPAPRNDTPNATPTDNNAGANAQKQGDNQAQGKTDSNAAAANQSNATAAAKAAQRTIAADAVTTQDAVPEEVSLAASTAKATNQKITATVTQAEAKTTSQPQTTLSARAAVDAEVTGRKGAATDAQLALASESEAAAEAEEGANNIFNRIKAEGTATGKSGNDATGPAPDSANAAKTGPNPAQVAANPNSQINAGLARGSSTAGQTSALTGTSQSGITVDSATGGTASLGQNNSIQQRSAAAPTTAASRPPPVPAQVIADQVAVNIQKGISQGQDRITVQLRPHELGRIEIKMEKNQDGKTMAVISAERPETLDILRQDQRSLIQTLTDAGLSADQNSLSFTLQGQDAGNDGGSQTAGNNGTDTKDTSEGDDLLQTGFVFEETGGFSNDGRLDVRI